VKMKLLGLSMQSEGWWRGTHTRKRNCCLHSFRSDGQGKNTWATENLHWSSKPCIEVVWWMSSQGWYDQPQTMLMKQWQLERNRCSPTNLLGWKVVTGQLVYI
jgi:hypothetical protein